MEFKSTFGYDRFSPVLSCEISGSGKTASVPAEQNSDLEIDEIIEKLKNGDLSDLSVLKSACSYLYMEKTDNGYTIEFTYEGKDYYITYVNNSKTTEDHRNDLISSLRNGRNGRDDIRSEQGVSLPDYSDEFDLSGIPNADSPIDDLYNNDGVSDDYLRNSLLSISKTDEDSTVRDINSGAWDKLLESMAQIKKQLHQYIKTQLEAMGVEYDKEFVDSKLDMVISIVAQRAVTGGNHISFVGDPLYNLDTVEDCVNAVIDYIKQGINLSEFFNPENKNISPTHNKVLEKTADYFLTDDERKLKEVLQYVDTESGCSRRVQSTEKMEDYLRVYADYMKQVLKYEHPNLTDNDISNIIDMSLKDAKDYMKHNMEEFYDVGKILQKFAENCEKFAAMK